MGDRGPRRARPRLGAHRGRGRAARLPAPRPRVPRAAVALRAAGRLDRRDGAPPADRGPRARARRVAPDRGRRSRRLAAGLRRRARRGRRARRDGDAGPRRLHARLDPRRTGRRGARRGCLRRLVAELPARRVARRGGALGMSAGAPARGPADGVARLGDRALDVVEAAGDFARLAAATARAALRGRFPWREVLRQLEAIGARSTTIVLLTALFTGMVLALQTGFALERFGAKLYVGSVVGLSLARELGPVLTALMVGGRVGAGIAAEIGSMQVTEQVDAIRALGADPVQKLVLPRVVAGTLALPLLASIANVLGVLGGLAIATTQFQIPGSFYLQTIYRTVTVTDMLSGVSKTFAFGWIIAMVGCFVGLRATGGTVGVRRAAPRAAGVRSIAVLIVDFFLTQALLAL